jgi:hypothetical protein
MLHGRREWDEQLIRECMYNHDALEVLQIRLSDKSQEDQIAWALEKSGIFSVKSAYRLALNIDFKCKSGWFMYIIQRYLVSKCSTKGKNICMETSSGGSRNST